MPIDRLLHPGLPEDPTAGGGTASSVSVIHLPSNATLKTLEVGHTIGPYKIQQLLGEGGFGFVYLAEQQEPVRRKVALKILKLGMDTHQVIARFEAERQALAMMDHPNIAKVLDAGATELGRPYFVMELVKGIPITQYCDENRLAPKERLVLFMLVCNAVQHAHTKGIIHRDLKPSNILIAMLDGKPVPKVIDFGIAKAIDQKLTEKTVFTEYHQLIGTPEYMSPEQAEMSGIDIDTRSDVYSLGVLLYELLTGTTPFDAKELRKAGYGEIQRIIREVDPPKPSTRMTELISMRVVAGKASRAATMTPGTWNQNPVELSAKIDAAIDENTSAQGIARSRRTEPAGLCKLLKGDLDWITMKALEKDRTRRYDTASAFSMDVLKYLCDETVSASPPSLKYRFWKFARRNRLFVSSIAAITLVLVAAMTLTSIFAVRAARSRDLADQARKDAERERDEALLSKSDLTLAVESSQSDSELSPARIRQCLEMYARLGKDQEPNAAFAWSLLSRYYSGRNDRAQTLDCTRKAFDLLRVLPLTRRFEPILHGLSMVVAVHEGMPFVESWTVQEILARARSGLISQYEQSGDIEGAVHVLGDWIDESLALPESSAADVSAQYLQLGSLLEGHGRLEQASATYARSIAFGEERQLVDQPGWRLWHFGNYGLLLIRLKDYDQAEKALLAAAAEPKDADVYSHNPIQRRTIMRALVELYQLRNSPEEAGKWQSLLREAEAATQPANR